MGTGASEFRRDIMLPLTMVLTPSPMIVKNAVATSNAVALSNELLKFFDSAAGYRHAVLYVTTNRLTTALVEYLDSHTDSPMFILQALMAVGKIAKTRGLDHEFEGMVSKFLLDVFCSPPPFSLGTPQADVKLCFFDGDDGCGNSRGSGEAGPSSELPPLPDDINLSSMFATSSTSHDTYFSSSISSTYITNTAISTFPQKSKSRRKKMNTNPIGIGAGNSLPDEEPTLLDFANYPSIAQNTSRNKSAVQGKPFNIMDANNDIIFDDLIDLIDLIDLTAFQSTPTTRPTNHHQHDPTLTSLSTKTKGHLNISLPSPIINTTSHRHLYEQQSIASQETHNRTIQPHHHQEIEQGYIEEAASLAIRLPISRGTGIDTKLVATLVEKNKLDMIHELIGDNKDICRTLLHLVDRRLAVQI
ncbi:hypothetical protein BGZ47_000635 [Haplosporangium gracile]|nr:hypothetical protein BGZ47_000635 [Haplosporangium gracile]